MSLILANSTLAALSPRTVQRAHLSISNGRIDAVLAELPAGDHEIIDCAGRVIMPGNVCAHTHLYSVLARGMPGPRQTPHNFLEILEYIWWRLDRALDEPAIRYSALVGALDAARAGTTTLIDHHASPNYIDGSLDVLAGGIDEVGVRAVVCYEVTDRGGKQKRETGLRENERFLRSNRRERIKGVVGAHASFTLEDETLGSLAELARDFETGVHIHVAEDQWDEVDAQRRCGKRTADRLAAAGVLNAQSIAAHGVHLEPDELHLIEQRQTWLVHNCRSNLNNSVGRAPVLHFGHRAALGTDGIDQDMFAESRTAYFRAREDDLNVYAEQFADLLAGGGELTSEFFDLRVGTLEAGSAADLMILKYDSPTPLAADNLAWHWMFAMAPHMVESVMVHGSWVVWKGEPCRVDEERIRAEARTRAARLWERMEAL